MPTGRNSVLGGCPEKGRIPVVFGSLPAMKGAGLAPDDERVMLPGMVEAMSELHIEQSLALEGRAVRTGVVGIVGLAAAGQPGRPRGGPICAR